jgi:hypothetical protein
MFSILAPLKIKRDQRVFQQPAKAFNGFAVRKVYGSLGHNLAEDYGILFTIEYKSKQELKNQSLWS